MKISANSIEVEANLDREIPTEMKPQRYRPRKDLFAILESLVDDRTVSNLAANLDGIENYLWRLNRLVVVLHEEEGFGSKPDVLACHRCRGHIDHGSIHYRCSHCRKIVLCEKCELYSDDFHDYDYIKIKKHNHQDRYCEPLIFDFIQNLSALLCGFKVQMSDLVEKARQNRHKPSESLSHILAGSKFSKIWNIVNNGDCDWGEEITLQNVSGNIEPANGERIIPVKLQAGQTRHISIDFVIPETIEEPVLFHSQWCFFNQGQKFGQPLAFKVMGIPKEEAPSSLDSEEIEYPPCFDLSVPFLPSPNLAVQSLVEPSQLNRDREPGDACVKQDAQNAGVSGAGQVSVSGVIKLPKQAQKVSPKMYPIPVPSFCSPGMAAKIAKHNEKLADKLKQSPRPADLSTTNQSGPKQRQRLYGSYLKPEARKKIYAQIVKNNVQESKQQQQQQTKATGAGGDSGTAPAGESSSPIQVSNCCRKDNCAPPKIQTTTRKVEQSSNIPAKPEQQTIHQMVEQIFETTKKVQDLSKTIQQRYS